VLAAVEHAPRCSGAGVQTEGQITKLKRVKRHMYGIPINIVLDSDFGANQVA